MLEIEGVDLELPQMGKEPKMGYADEFIEKTMISGKIRRIYRGKRFYATFSYAFLRPIERDLLEDLLKSQHNKGFLNVEISSPYGDFSGEAILELNNDQTRFKWDEDEQDYVWTNWQLSIKATEYAEE